VKEKMSKVETVEITVKVPKLAIEYLGKIYGNAVEWLEYAIVDCVRADIDAIDPERLVDMFGLKPVFKTLLRNY